MNVFKKSFETSYFAEKIAHAGVETNLCISNALKTFKSRMSYQFICFFQNRQSQLRRNQAKKGDLVGGGGGDLQGIVTILQESRGICMDFPVSGVAHRFLVFFRKNSQVGLVLFFPDPNSRTKKTNSLLEVARYHIFQEKKN